MAPAWKIKREIKRLGQQIAYIPWLVTAPRRKRAYDATKASRITLTEGQHPVTDDLCILLIYQPQGLKASTLHTLDHFASRNIATLVVSNAPLSPSDRETLAHHCWQILERPNYGYDFGGYRDAILHLLDGGTRPRNLFVLNDSIWFPLGDDTDLVDEALAAKADLYGFVYNDKMRGEHRQHIQSYFFRFGPTVTASASFQDHWRDLFLTNNKTLVVRRCEIPMTDSFQRMGFTVAARHSYVDAARALRDLDDDTLRDVLAYQARVDTRNATWLKRLWSASHQQEDWRRQVEDAVDAGRFDKYFMIAHPAILLGQLHAPLLKKDRQSIYRLQRAELLKRGFDTGFASVIRDEIRDWDKSPVHGQG